MHETRKAMMDSYREGECDFLRKTVVLFIVSRAIRQAPLLSEPSQLPSQLLTGILNQQLMCSEICPPPHGPNAHTHSNCLFAACIHAPPLDPSTKLQNWSSMQNRHIGAFVPVSLHCACIRTDSGTSGLRKGHLKQLPRKVWLKHSTNAVNKHTCTCTLCHLDD